MADIPYFGKRRCGFQCDNQQVDLFRRASARTILNCSRQTGKSTAAALKAVHTAYFQPNATILVTAPSKNQTREFLRKVRNLAIVAGVSC